MRATTLKSSSAASRATAGGGFAQALASWSAELASTFRDHILCPDSDRPAGDDVEARPE
jgi:hypothetical protein